MRQVKPEEAKKGIFLKSFDVDLGPDPKHFNEMLAYIRETEAAAKRNRLNGEIVFTKITGKRKISDTWQVFILRK